MAQRLRYGLIAGRGMARHELKETLGMATQQEQVRDILAKNGRLAVPVETLNDDSDLFSAGLDSLAIVNVLMSLEEQFDIELPDEMLQRKSFASIATITTIVNNLSQEAAHT